MRTRGVGSGHTRTLSLQVVFCEGVDGGADGGEAVAAGGGKRARELQRFERVGGVGEDFGGRGVVVKIGEQCDEPEDDGGVGGNAEVTPALAKLGD